MYKIDTTRVKATHLTIRGSTITKKCAKCIKKIMENCFYSLLLKRKKCTRGWLTVGMSWQDSNLLERRITLQITKLVLEQMWK